MFRGKICDISQIDMTIEGEEPQSTSIIISHIYITVNLHKHNIDVKSIIKPGEIQIMKWLLIRLHKMTKDLVMPIKRLFISFHLYGFRPLTKISPAVLTGSTGRPSSTDQVPPQLEII